MSPEIKKVIESRLQRIVNVLMLNASFIDNIGLLNGKMGIAIFFYHYARYTKDEIYERYAGELIDEIYDEINNTTPVNFSNGLTGIGWGIEYLVKNNFVEADTDEALKEIDEIILRERCQKPLLLDWDDDIFGHGFYYLARIWNSDNANDNLSFLMKKESIIYLVDECERLLIHLKYVKYRTPNIRISTLNSIIYFLIEADRLKLFPVKVQRLFRSLLSYIALIKKNNDIIIDHIVLTEFLDQVGKINLDKDIQKHYKILLRMQAQEFNLENI